MDEIKHFFELIEEGYKKRRATNNLSIEMLKNIIEAYYTYIEKPEFEILVDEYKSKYIYNEARVEKNITKEEQLGLGEIYDYINQFDFEKNHFNIFITSMILHQKLYSKCPAKEFGGKLRDSSVFLNDTYIEIMEPLEAQKKFNEYISTSDKIFEPLNENDLFGYINNCIILVANLIKIQPFLDGNKRTFRALLNLLFKKIELPPIYIDIDERDEYKEYLMEAMKEQKYDNLIKFYYLKICDVIVEMNLNLSIISEKPKEKIIEKVK